MIFDSRTSVVQRILRDYVRSPSLRHIRHERSVEKLSVEIVTALDHETGHDPGTGRGSRSGRTPCLPPAAPRLIGAKGAQTPDLRPRSIDGQSLRPVLYGGGDMAGADETLVRLPQVAQNT